MAQKRFRGPNGAVVTFEVPGPGMDQDYYDRKVKSGEYVEVEAETPKRKPGRPPKSETTTVAPEGDAESE